MSRVAKRAVANNSEEEPSAALDPVLRRQIGQRLGAALKRKDVTLAGAAALCGLERQAAWNWVHGKNLPALAQLYRIAKEYRLSVDHILFGSLYTPEALDMAREITDLPQSQRDALKAIFGPTARHK